MTTFRPPCFFSADFQPPGLWRDMTPTCAAAPPCSCAVQLLPHGREGRCVRGVVREFMYVWESELTEGVVLVSREQQAAAVERVSGIMCAAESLSMVLKGKVGMHEPWSRNKQRVKMKSIINALKKEGKKPACSFSTFQISRCAFGRSELAPSPRCRPEVRVEEFPVASLRLVHLHVFSLH